MRCCRLLLQHPVTPVPERSDLAKGPGLAGSLRLLICKMGTLGAFSQQSCDEPSGHTKCLVFLKPTLLPNKSSHRFPITAGSAPALRLASKGNHTQLLDERDARGGGAAGRAGSPFAAAGGARGAEPRLGGTKAGHSRRSGRPGCAEPGLRDWPPPSGPRPLPRGALPARCGPGH